MQATVFIQPFILLAAGMTFTLGAQTNSPPSPPAPVPLFNLPAPILRTTTATTTTTALPKPAPSPVAKIKPADDAEPQPSVAFVSRAYGAWDFEHARSWHGRYEIVQPIHRPDDLFSRSIYSVFAPEVIHVGKTTVAFSVWTAIKRKNPLCLINPVPLSVSW